MSSPSNIPNETNRLIKENRELLELASSETIGNDLKELNYDWNGYIGNEQSKIVPILRTSGLIELVGSKLKLNRFGLLFLSRLLLHFQINDEANNFGTLNEKYKNFTSISSGKNSIVVRAQHRLLDSWFVLKLVRPGASADIARSIKILSHLRLNSSIVTPIDLIRVEAIDILDKPLCVDCLVFPFVEGITLRQFFAQENHHLNSQVALSFARQIGAALNELEKIGAYHGDLHDANILVDQYSHDGIKFKIVDISFDAMGSLPFEECRNNDLTNFKQHLWRLLRAQKASLPNISLRKYIGTRSFDRIMEILSDQTKTFADVCHALSDEHEYKNYLQAKSKFINEQFHSPVSFRLQRYEEIADQTVAVQLFVPFEQLMNKIETFSNMYISGNRGSGKSTYLASLAFFPHAEDSIVNYRQIFGVYFPCRQGEFRPLEARSAWSNELCRRIVTHVLVIKIVRRTLETIAAGIATNKLRYPIDLDKLRKLVEIFVPPPGIVAVEHDIQSELENFVSTMVRVEMEEINHLSTVQTDEAKRHDLSCLLDFFSVIRSTFDELSTTRFHLLFDDSGLPYVPSSVQRVINDLILTSNSLFCVKLSAEKLTFEFESSEDKILENGQDYFEYDISQILFIGTGSGGINRAVLQEYFRKIVEKRLVHFSYQSANIADYLGDELISVDDLLRRLAASRRDAYYCGWTTVWNIADRTPRNLLEIVSEIFSVAGIDADSKPRKVSAKNQDLAIRTLSEKRLESLSQIPGSILIQGKIVSLGRHLFETTAAIGSIFRQYLKTEPLKNGRKRQHLAIERNDLQEMTAEAELVLKRLITFGVLDSSRSAFARNDEVKKPFYVLNRIYCPAFSIGFRRDEHLKLSNGKLEQLLLNAQQFMRDGTRRLRDNSEQNGNDLFSYKEWHGRN